jgi:2-dehydro-3-deoxyphosphogalactonate aldolase
MTLAEAALIKVFPTDAVSPGVLRALKDILPGNVLMMPVDRVSIEKSRECKKAGTVGFRIGSAITSRKAIRAPYRKKRGT